MTKAQYALFRKLYLELKKQSDKEIDGESCMRLKNIYLKQFSPFEKEYRDCNIYEVAELKKRSEILKWASDDLMTQLIQETTKEQALNEHGEDPLEAALNVKFVEQLL